MKTEKHEIVNAAGKLQPYRRGKERFDIQNTQAYQHNRQEIERIIHLIRSNNLGPQPYGDIYTWKSEEEISRILGTDGYLTMLALAIVLNEETAQV